MICGILVAETYLQIGDKTRLDASKSFITKGEAAITKVEIDSGDGTGFVDVTDNDQSQWFLDWVYSGSSRVINPQVRITTNGAPSTPVQVTMNLLTAADDYLFSGDKDLVPLEPDIMKWIPDGRASWLNVHRSAQEKIMDWLRKTGITDPTGNPYVKTDLMDIEEVRIWSRDWTLGLIFHSISNTIGDVFDKKAAYYFDEANKGSDRAHLRLDVNKSGTLEVGEALNLTSATLVRE